MLRRSVLLVGIALGGCQFEPIEPITEPPATASPARLVLHAEAMDGAGVRQIELIAWFQPGRDTRGEPRQVVRDSLGIFGTMLGPEFDRGTELVYRHTWPLDAAWANADGPLRLPTPAGLEPQALFGALRVLTADLPDTVVVADELVLGLNRHSEYGPDDRWRWTLQITAGDPRILVLLLGAEAAPDTIRIPRSLLPDLEEAQLHLRVDGLSEHDLLSGEYHVTVREEALIARVLRFTNPAP